MPTFSRPAHQPARPQHTAEFFSNADHTAIYGGSFSIHNSTTQLDKKGGFQILQKHVAASAFHNSKERRDPPRCHEHTREAVLDEIFEWIVGNVARKTWIAWLNGAAGAGKSAICQSIAKRCICHGILVASFFFFRTDNTRNSIDPLVATLAYQIIQLLPETKRHIVEAIEENPLVFEQAFEAQLDLLVVRPLSLLQVTDPTWTLLLIVDGLDECGGEATQMSLIRTIAKLLRSKNVPLIVLFGSRRENQLVMAFNSREMTGILKQLALDDNYQAEEDIRCFLDDSFDEIKQMHPFRKRLAADWPSPDHVQEIVDKSSGQFIYASVVIKFLFSPSAKPSIMLDIIRGLRPTGRLTPFAELDVLYRHIFLHVEDLPTTLMFLAYLILADTKSLYTTSYFFNLEFEEVESMFVPLASVIFCNVEVEEITFHHASLPDFLRDEARSGAYCINTLATPLAIQWFKAVESGHFRNCPYGPYREEKPNVDIPDLLQSSEPTSELYECLISYTPSQHPLVYEEYDFASNFLKAISNMNFGDDNKAYLQIMKTMVRFTCMRYPEAFSEIADADDVSEIVVELVLGDGIDVGSEDENKAILKFFKEIL